MQTPNERKRSHPETEERPEEAKRPRQEEVEMKRQVIQLLCGYLADVCDDDTTGYMNNIQSFELVKSLFATAIAFRHGLDNTYVDQLLGVYARPVDTINQFLAACDISPAAVVDDLKRFANCVACYHGVTVPDWKRIQMFAEVAKHIIKELQPLPDPNATADEIVEYLTHVALWGMASGKEEEEEDACSEVSANVCFHIVQLLSHHLPEGAADRAGGNYSGSLGKLVEDRTGFKLTAKNPAEFTSAKAAFRNWIVEELCKVYSGKIATKDDVIDAFGHSCEIFNHRNLSNKLGFIQHLTDVADAIALDNGIEVPHKYWDQACGDGIF